VDELLRQASRGEDPSPFAVERASRVPATRAGGSLDG